MARKFESEGKITFKFRHKVTEVTTTNGAADGVTDESYYIAAFVSGEIDRRSSFTTNIYANRFKGGFNQGEAVTGYGGSAAYSRNLTSRLSARAALAIDSIESDVSVEDFTTASALVGLRLGF